VAQLVIPRFADARNNSGLISEDCPASIQLIKNSHSQMNSPTDYVAPDNDSPDSLQGSGTR
jgi:hypothetical protein